MARVVTVKTMYSWAIRQVKVIPVQVMYSLDIKPVITLAMFPMYFTLPIPRRALL